MTRTAVEIIEIADRIDHLDHRLNDGRVIDGQIVMGGTDIQDECQRLRSIARDFISSTDHESELRGLAEELDARAKHAEWDGESSMRDPGEAAGRAAAFREAAERLRDRVGQQPRADEPRADLPNLGDEARWNPYSIGTALLADHDEDREHPDEIPRALITIAERADSGREVGDELRAMAERIRFAESANNKEAS